MTTPFDVTLSDLTPAARRAVLDYARRYGPAKAAALAEARRDPRSRAVDLTTVYGSGSRRRVYNSTVTGELIDTESANWPPTAHARARIEAHENEMALRGALSPVSREITEALAEGTPGTPAQAGRFLAQFLQGSRA